MQSKLITISLLLSFITALPIFADDDEDEHHEMRGHATTSKTPGVTPVSSETYVKECTACHMAYQAGLLPKRSWEKLMAGLEDHFGENAELAAETQAELTKYLVENSADDSQDRVPMKLMRGLSEAETPLRITEIPYMQREHRKLSKKMVVDNPEVKSLSYCNKCHTRAEEGSYSEREIKIPGFGRWED